MSMGHSLGTSRWCGPGVTRALFLDAARPAAWTLVGGSGLVAVVTGIRLLWGGSAVPDPLTWLAVVLLSVVWSQSVVLPAAGVVGTVAALARWGDEGAWTGARASGGCGRSLLPAVLLIGLATSTATAGVTLVLEPIARRAGRRVLHDGLAEVALLPGRMVESGDLALRARRVRDGVGEEVFVARGPVVLTARTATVVRQVLPLAHHGRGGRGAALVGAVGRVDLAPATDLLGADRALGAGEPRARCRGPAHRSRRR